MTRPRPAPRLDDVLRRLLSRVALLENRRPETLTPVVVASAVTINSTTSSSPFVTYLNPTGSTITWWLQVTPALGTVTSLRVRESGGQASDVVEASNAGQSLVSVTLAIPPDWQPGELRLVYLDAWIDTNSATLLPLRVVVA